MSPAFLLALVCLGQPASDRESPGGALQAEFVFPLDARHNHAPGIVECPNGDLLASWYRGSGERKADDVSVLGARQRKGDTTWSEPFLLADTPGFPDCNTCLFVDRRQRLWLFWPTSLAVSVSDDEGRSWKWTRHLERHANGAYHYPAVIQGADGRVHVIYSYFVEQGKTMKHAAFMPEWVRAGDGKSTR